MLSKVTPGFSSLLSVIVNTVAAGTLKLEAVSARYPLTCLRLSWTTQTSCGSCDSEIKFGLSNLLWRVCPPDS